jgi:hypothetical protein
MALKKKREKKKKETRYNKRPPQQKSTADLESLLRLAIHEHVDVTIIRTDASVASLGESDIVKGGLPEIVHATAVFLEEASENTLGRKNGKGKNRCDMRGVSGRAKGQSRKVRERTLSCPLLRCQK